MVQHKRGKDGRYAGSVGDGKTHVPTAAPTSPGTPAVTAPSSPAGVDTAYASFKALTGKTPGVITVEAERCPACGQFISEVAAHTCPPEDLRRYAVAEDTATAELYHQQFIAGNNLEIIADRVRRTSGQDYDRVRGGYRWDGSLEDAQAMLTEHIEEAEAAGETYLARTGRYTGQTRVQDARKMLTDLGIALAEQRRIQAEIRAANERYQRFGWTRAFLVVTNGSGGHVHKDMNCSSCYPTTRYVWLPQYSGGTEDTIVQDAGERACTVCWPSAPTDVLSRPTRIYSEDERQALVARDERAAERERKRAERAAKAATADGSELVIVTEEGTYAADYYNARLRGQPYRRTESFKTERSAVTWATDKLAGTWRPMTDREREAVDVIAASIAEKRGVDPSEVRAEIEAKAEAKRRRTR